MESSQFLGELGEMSKSSITLINLEENPTNKIVKEKIDFTMGCDPFIPQDVECKPFVIDLSHLELPVVNYVEEYAMDEKF